MISPLNLHRTSHETAICVLNVQKWYLCFELLIARHFCDIFIFCIYDILAVFFFRFRFHLTYSDNCLSLKKEHHQPVDSDANTSQICGEDDTKRSISFNSGYKFRCWSRFTFQTIYFIAQKHSDVDIHLFRINVHILHDTVWRTHRSLLMNFYYRCENFICIAFIHKGLSVCVWKRTVFSHSSRAFCPLAPLSSPPPNDKNRTLYPSGIRLCFWLEFLMASLFGHLR